MWVKQLSISNNDPNPILLVGSGGHAHSCVDVVETVGFRIIGFVGLAHEVGQSVLSYSVLGTDDDLPELMKAGKSALVSVGQIDTPALRIRLFEHLHIIGYDLPAIVSPLAYVSAKAKIGAGTIVIGDVVGVGLQADACVDREVGRADVARRR